MNIFNFDTTAYLIQVQNSACRRSDLLLDHNGSRRYTALKDSFNPNERCHTQHQHASTVMVSYRMKSLKKNDEPTKTPTPTPLSLHSLRERLRTNLLPLRTRRKSRVPLLPPSPTPLPPLRLQP
jgi:hypothetical protein